MAKVCGNGAKTMANDAQQAIRPKGITIPVIRNSTQTLGPRSGPAAYTRAVRRYNITTSTFTGKNGQVFKKALGTDGEESEVPADSVQNDLQYVVSVKIGTPGVSLNLDFDTGSSDLWVWSSELRSSSSGHNIYNPKNSSTAKIVKGATWNISYGDGSSASGNVYTDVVSIGDVTIPAQAVELSEKLSSSFQQDGGSDGLLGLAWPSLNTVTPTAQATPVENMINQNIISLPLFSANLDREDNSGFYTFGVIDAANAGISESQISYTPVDNSQGFWMFPSTTATVNGTAIDLSGNTAIADTGTTLALVSDSVVSAIYAAIPGSKMDDTQGGYVYPENATVPDVEFAVGNNMFKINASDFSLGPASGGMLFGGIQSRGTNGFDILGDVFLKSVYVVFDQGNTRIGMAQRAT